MIKNRLRFAGVGIIGSILALVLILAPVPSHAKEKAKDAGSVAVLEKKMLAKSTKKISFRQGKIRSTSRKVWKKGKKIKKSEKHSAERKSVLDGIPRALPQLSRAEKIQKKRLVHTLRHNNLREKEIDAFVF